MTIRGTAIEEHWQPARLIPTSGIKGVDEQEKRATSALLSVMMAVPEFSRAMLKRMGAPGAAPRTYIEPEIETATGSKIRPDGAILVSRAGVNWCALVEVKTSTNELRVEQIEAYLDLARDHGFDAVITISNQLATASDIHPLSLSRSKTRRVRLYHLSWVEILTEAVMQREHRGVSDPEQAWILGELIAYLKHPQSGAMPFQDMGPNWVSVRESAREGTIRGQDPGVTDVVQRWDQFIQYLRLHLAADLGVEVTQVLSKEESSDPAVRKQALVKTLLTEKTLAGALRVKSAPGIIILTAALNARTIAASMSIDAPAAGKPSTRVNWLARQLRDAPDDLVIHAAFTGVRATNSCRLGEIRTDPGALLLPDKSRTPRSFVVAKTRNMGLKRGGVAGSFVGEATDLLLTFYREVVQSLRPWSAPVPQLPTTRRVDDIAEEPANVVSVVATREAAAHSATSAADVDENEAEEDAPEPPFGAGEGVR